MTERDLLLSQMDDGAARRRPGQRADENAAAINAALPRSPAMHQYGNQPGVAPGTPPAPPGPAMHQYGNQPGVAQPSGQTMRQSWDPATTSHQVQTGLPATPAVAATDAAQRNLEQWGQYAPEGYDQGKIDRGHDSPKYQIGRVLSNFDPTQGLTPEVMAALDALGIGKFERIDGDKLRVTGDYDPRFLDHTEFDLVRNFTNDGTGSTAWQFQTMKDEGGAAPTQAAGSPALQNALTGGADAMGRINQLFPSDMGAYHTLEQRLQQILGGPRALDRDALLSQMTR